MQKKTFPSGVSRIISKRIPSGASSSWDDFQSFPCNGKAPSNCLVFGLGLLVVGLRSPGVGLRSFVFGF